MSTWTINPTGPTVRVHRGHYTIKKDGYEVGTFSLLEDLYYPETVLAAICDALAEDERLGVF